METAFAFGTHAFATKLHGKRSGSNNPDELEYLGLTRNRWGWAMNLPSSPVDGAEYAIWAGAGLNNTDNGTLVGITTIDWDGSTLTVSYDMDEPFEMEEAHVYASDLEPTTIAPGQYGHTVYFDPYESTYSESIDVSDSDGDGVWIIMHAVVGLPTE